MHKWLLLIIAFFLSHRNGGQETNCRNFGQWQEKTISICYKNESLNTESIETLTGNYNHVWALSDDELLYEDSSSTIDLNQSHLIIADKKGYLALYVHHPFDRDRYQVRDLDKPLSSKVVLASQIIDYDNDGFLEVGNSSIIESPCRGCDSTFYNPVIYYEFGKDFVIDSLLSKRATEEIMGVFLGYSTMDTVLAIGKR